MDEYDDSPFEYDRYEVDNGFVWDSWGENPDEFTRLDPDDELYDEYDSYELY